VADIHDLLEALGFTEKLHTALDAVTQNIRQTLQMSGTHIPDAAWDAFAKDLRNEPKIREAIERLATEGYPLDAAEMDEVVAFHRTPQGKRAMEKMAVVTQLVTQASSSQIERFGNALMEKMLKDK
jgi:hypothetical protein